ncbi:hypothetical protein FBU30_001474 [Linnemannia zychae]|nr:hypothetical protein FBU30_001474 [Linnemannia zychae]
MSRSGKVSWHTEFDDVVNSQYFYTLKLPTDIHHLDYFKYCSPRFSEKDALHRRWLHAILPIFKTSKIQQVFDQHSRLAREWAERIAEREEYWDKRADEEANSMERQLDRKHKLSLQANAVNQLDTQFQQYTKKIRDSCASTSTSANSTPGMTTERAEHSYEGTEILPLANPSTTPPGTPPSIAASFSYQASPPAYSGVGNHSATSETDSAVSNTAAGLLSSMNSDISPRPTEIIQTTPSTDDQSPVADDQLPATDDQSTISNEERTVLLSEIEKITHTCLQQEGETCFTCLFKRYQRLCVDALVNTELKIVDIADVASLIGILVPSRPTCRMKSVFSKEVLEALINSGKVTHEEWDSVEFDTQLPMKAVRLCIQNRMEDVAVTLAPLNKDHRPVRIMLETLLEYLPENEDRSISEYDFSVKHIGPILQAFFQSKSVTAHFSNKDSATQKKLGLRSDRPDFTVTVDKTEIAWGEFSGPAHENDKWKNHWDFFRELRYGKAFLDSGFRLAPLFQIIYEVGSYMRLRTETRGMYVLHEVGKFNIPTTTATVGTLIATFPTLLIAKA